MNKELSTKVITADMPVMTVDAMRQQVAMIQQAMRQVMIENTHYGVIPGTNQKPSLLKPGAEKICMMFRLIPSFEVIRRDLANAHLEYEVKCTLTTPTGEFMGQGVGLCSTMESKYRWRKGEGDSTGQPVPRDFWKTRDTELLGGKEFEARKVDGQWMICKKGERKENPDIADTYNTVLKMAKKRAHVDATITATAASDIFTQDVEDLIDRTEPARRKQEQPSDFELDDLPESWGLKTANKTLTPFQMMKNAIEGEDVAYIGSHTISTRCSLAGMRVGEAIKKDRGLVEEQLSNFNKLDQMALKAMLEVTPAEDEDIEINLGE